MGVVDEILRFPFTHQDELELDPAYNDAIARNALVRVELPYGGSAWLATRHEHVRMVMSDPRFSRAAATEPDTPRQMPGPPGKATILDVDRPAHSRLRRLVARAFTRERMNALRGDIETVAAGLLDRFDGRRDTGVDLVAEFALPLPMTIICQLLGVPYRDRAHFRRLTEGVLAIRKLPREEFAEVVDGLDTYLTELVRNHRDHPADDVLGILVTARDGRDQLSEEELISFGATLLAAGYETTASHLSSAVYFLASRPEIRQHLLEGRWTLRQSVEELLRFIPMNGGSGLPRVALEDLRVGDTLVRAGEAVFPSTVAANRDPRVFPAPEAFRPDRAENPHLTFGHGFHHCLGAHLVRMESEVSLGLLLSRFPGIRLAVPAEEIEWKRGTVVRGPKALPVTW